VTILGAAFWVICLVLVAAGATKLAEPAPLGAALATLGVPGAGSSAGARVLVSVVGVIEMLLGIGGLAVGGAAFALGVAVAYATFACVVLVALRRALPSCGCFGSRSGPPSRVHAVVNLASAFVAVAAVLRPTPAVADAVEGRGLGGAAVVLAVLCAALVVVVVDTRAGGATVSPQNSSGGTHD
jgi:hypothetical protein